MIDSPASEPKDEAGPERADGELKRPLAEGELVLLVDNKDRRYVIKLAADGDFQTHAGSLHHHLIIGQSEGHGLASTKGQKFTVYRPTLSDFIMTMPRGAQVIYPKDIGPMLMMADIGPGVKVFESGVGSGALSMAMLRAGAEITGYELRDDFAARARKNVAMFLVMRCSSAMTFTFVTATRGSNTADSIVLCSIFPSPGESSLMFPKPWERADCSCPTAPRSPRS